MVSSSETRFAVRAQNATTVVQGSSGERLGPWSFEVRRGEFLVLLGPHGCGKSSLIRMLAGVLPVTSGQVDHQEPAPGVVFSKPCLMPWRTVLENVLLAAELRRDVSSSTPQRARSLLGALGAAEYEQHYGEALPRGVAQRVALCRALVHKPALVLLDEPFGTLDALTRERLWLDLQRIWLDEGFGAILATAEISEAVLLGDRVAVMGHPSGEIVRITAVELPRPRRMSKSMTPLLAEYGDILRTILRAEGALP